MTRDFPPFVARVRLDEGTDGCSGRSFRRQIIGNLKEAEAGAVVTDLSRRHGMSSATSYAWKAKFGGHKVPEVKRLRSLEHENAKLKRLLAEAIMDNAGPNDLLSKNGSARREVRGGRASPSDVGDALGSQKEATSWITTGPGMLVNYSPQSGHTRLLGRRWYYAK